MLTRLAMHNSTMTLEISRLAVEIFIAQAQPQSGMDDAPDAATGRVLEAAALVAPRTALLRDLRRFLEDMHEFYVL